MSNKPFQFSNEDQAKINAIFERYPENQRRSAVMPLLTLAQERNGGWIPYPAIDHISELLDMPAIRVLEVATFYSMYQLEPVGKTVIKVCRTSPCWLRGSDELLHQCKKQLDLAPGETKNDITLMEVECLGACVNAPVIQVNHDYIEDLDKDSLSEVLTNIQNNKPIKAGSVKVRISSEPIGASE
jgi:NADH-quinone oxidoreductase E subunit